MEYKYPDNLCAKPVLWLWELKHVMILGAALLLSIIAFAQLHLFLPLVAAIVYGLITIRLDDRTILNYLQSCVRFFASQQIFYWKQKGEAIEP